MSSVNQKKMNNPKQNCSVLNLLFTLATVCITYYDPEHNGVTNDGGDHYQGESNSPQYLIHCPLVK